jgi:Concanavalin A-like lectin/glucanases superfamily
MHLIPHRLRTSIRLATGTGAFAILAVAFAATAAAQPAGRMAPSPRPLPHLSNPATRMAPPGLAVEFNGNNGYVEVPTAPALEPEHTNSFTAAFWVKLGSTNNNPLPFLWNKDGVYMCLMGDPANKQYRHVGMEVQNQTMTGNADGGATEFWGATRLQLNTWYHIVGTFNGATGQGLIYIDGRLETMTTIYPWPAAPDNTLHTTSSQPLLLARRHQDQRYNLDGQMSSFMFWTRALSPAEVAATYAADPPLDMALRYDFTAVHGRTVPDLSRSGAHPGLLMGSATLVGL